MELFVIKWEILEEREESLIILGFTNCGRCIRILDYQPYIYVHDDKEDEGCERSFFIRGNRNVTNEISEKRFRNSDEIRRYARSNNHTTIYEQDVDTLTKFLSEAGLDVIGWVGFEDYYLLSDENRISHCQEYVVKLKDLHNLNDKVLKVPDVKVLAFDIECYSEDKGMSDARKDEDVIFMVSMIFFNNNSSERSSYVLALDNKTTIEKKGEYIYETFDDEFSMLNEFFEKIRLHDPSIVTGYNITGFDMKYIRDKYYSNLLNIPSGGRCKEEFLRDEVISLMWNSAAYGIVDSTIFNFVGRCCVDIFRYLKTEVPLQKYSLDFVSKKFIEEKKVDMPYVTMFEKYKRGEVEDIADYCYHDSLLTVKLWEKFQLWYTVCEEAKIFCVDIHDLYTRGQQKKVFNQIYHYAHPKGYIFDKVPNLRENFSYEGAIVLKPQPGIYSQCAVVDFASLYPSIIISENICYTTYDPTTNTFRKDVVGVVPSILRFLISARKEVKKKLKEEKDETLRLLYDKRQFAYKVATNSFYGAFGSRDSSYLQLLPGAEMVTKVGRLHLQKAIEIINGHPIGCQVIYGDTDSCFFTGKEKELCYKDIDNIIGDINRKFPDPVKVDYEKTIEKILLLAKKKYIYLQDGRIQSKGVITAKRDSCLWAQKVYQEVISKILHGHDNISVNRYIREEIMDILGGNVGPELLFINKNLGRNYKLENYPLRIFSKVLEYAEDRVVNPGERLEYYFVRSTHKYQGYHMASKNMIEKYNLPIDYRYYIDKQLKSPLVQIYQALGWNFRNI